MDPSPPVALAAPYEDSSPAFWRALSDGVGWRTGIQLLQFCAVGTACVVCAHANKFIVPFYQIRIMNLYGKLKFGMGDRTED